MDIQINPEPPEIMHIDLNSAFAMTEQQANPLLRGRPVGITNRINAYSICITASYEAKCLGIGVGTRQREAKLRAPGFVMLESDAPKYQYVHRQLRSIFQSYSQTAYMKSIDEGIIDFTGMRKIMKGRSLEDVGNEIKQRIREEVGDYMTVNVGIGQNRWLAKIAAGFMKPDGLYTISRDNLEVVYGLMRLTDLPYIASRNKLRLNAANIFAPLEFFAAPERVLTKQVFKSVVGHHWYLKLRGYETEVEYGIKTVGRSYVLEHRTSDPEEIALLLNKACIKISRRLKLNNLAARGLMVQFGYTQTRMTDDWPSRGYAPSWRARRMYGVAVRRADQLYRRAMGLFWESPAGETLVSIMITAYAAEPACTEQLCLYDSEDVRLDRLEDAMNAVNDKYGELTIIPAAVAKSKNPMKDKIPFGTIRYF